MERGPAGYPSTSEQAPTGAGGLPSVQFCPVILRNLTPVLTMAAFERFARYVHTADEPSHVVFCFTSSAGRAEKRFAGCVERLLIDCMALPRWPWDVVLWDHAGARDPVEGGKAARAANTAIFEILLAKIRGHEIDWVVADSLWSIHGGRVHDHVLYEACRSGTQFLLGGRVSAGVTASEWTNS